MKILYLLQLAFVTLWCTVFSSSLYAQNFLINEIDGRTIETCEGFFLDSGGRSDDYSNREDFEATICPDNTTGTSIQLRFSEVDLFDNDELCFYDGTSSNAPLLACAADFDPDGPSFLNVINTPPFFIQATVNNTSGCITVTFNSNNRGNRSGWQSTINCIPVCQSIQVALESSIPAVMPVDTGWINACPGQPISLFSDTDLAFPEEGVLYNHRDSATYRWDFGDGTTAVGPSATHIYEEAGGYTIQLTITDQFGCTNTNFLDQRVRVSPKPNFDAIKDFSTPICVGDSTDLTARISSSDGSVSVNPNEASFATSAIRSDSLALPDGDGTFYETSLSFFDFTPGQTIESQADFESICVNIEHSYVLDLEIELFCPNGQSAVLHQHVESARRESYLGIPIDPDNEFTCPVDQRVYTEDGVFSNCRGEGYEYCWTPEATGDNLFDAASDFPQETIPAGNYPAFQGFNNFVGCPLNGEWKLRVTDNISRDNGFIYYWGINFDPALFPDLETFQPDFTGLEWLDNSSVLFNGGDSIFVSPINAGNPSYTLRATNEYGCVFDTAFTLTVLPPTHPDCRNCDNFSDRLNLRDTTVCEASAFSLNAGPNLIPTPITFEATPNFERINANTHTQAMPYESSIEVTNISPNIFIDPFVDLISICVDIGVDPTEFGEDLGIALRAPSGSIINLARNVGGEESQGQGFDNICFTPTAATTMRDARPPYAGNYLAESNIGNLNGQSIVGTWTLLIWDIAGNGNSMLNSWAITFNNRNPVTYSWSPATGLSCDDCSNPTVDVASTTTYNVETRDGFGCVDDQDITISIVSDFIAPPVTYDLTDTDELTFNWVPQEGVQYEVSINGGPYIVPNNGNNSHTINGIANGETVNFELRPIVPNLGADCVVESTFVEARNSACRLRLVAVGDLQAVSCIGDTDGAIEYRLTDAMAPLQYTLDGVAAGIGTTVTTGTIGDLAAGNHELIIEDAEGCTDTLNFIIPEPAPFVINSAIENVQCKGGMDGAIVLEATGGTGTLSFDWATGITTNSLTNIEAGEYIVTITDENACQIIDSLNVSEPDSLTLTIAATDQSCSDLEDGTIFIRSEGGTGLAGFVWSNTAVGNQLFDLATGIYTVTASDENGCETVDSVEIGAPLPLSIRELTVENIKCNGENTGSATVVMQGGQTPYEYLWSDPLGQNAAQANQLSVGTYLLQVTDANGCTFEDSIQIEEPAALSVTLDVSDVVCFGGENGTATAMPTGGVEPYQFVWNEDANLTNVVLTDLSVGDYTVQVADANDCITTAEFTINQPEAPITADILQTFKACFGERENEATVIASGGNGSNYRYEWDNGQTGQTATGLDTTRQTVTVIDEKECRETFTTTTSLEDLPRYEINIIATNPSCNGVADGVLGVNVIQGGLGKTPGDTIYNYSWNFNPNLNERLIENIEGGQIYTVTVTDPQGCEGVASRPLDQPLPITFTMNSTPANCFGATDGMISASNIIGGTPFNDGSYEYRWSNGGMDSLVENVTAGNYALTIVDVNNCEGSAEVEVLQPEQIIANFTVTDATCSGLPDGSVTTSVTGGIPTYNLLWSTDAVTSTINGLTAGAYTLSVTDANNCERTFIAMVNQPDSVSVEVEQSPITCAGGRDGSFMVTVAGGTTPYSYGLDGKSFSSSSTFIGLNADTYEVFARDINGCIGSTMVELPDPPVFEVDILDESSNSPAFIEINLGDPLNLYATSFNSVNGVEYVWTPLSPDSTLSCTECSRLTVSPTNTIYYELYGIDGNGCESIDQIQVRVRKSRRLLVPTGFTPNGDGVNDLLQVHGTNGITVKLFQVYDRYGELVYENTDFQVNDAAIGWDGIFRSKEAPSGIYVWIAEVEYGNGLIEVFKGNTTLLR